MTDTVNVTSSELRKIIRKEVDFCPGAWVDFFDDVTVNTLLLSEQMKETKSLTTGIDLLLGQIAAWNFADKDGTILPLSHDGIGKLSTKFLTWLTTQQAQILNSPEETSKKKV